MAFGTTRFIESEYDAPQGPAPGSVAGAPVPKPLITKPVIVRQPPVYYTQVQPVLMPAEQHLFQFTPMQLLIGGVLLYLLLKG